MKVQNARAHPRRRALCAGLTGILFPAGMAVLACGAGLVEHAGAATIVVDSAAEPGSANTCTLRQAVVSMNDGVVSGTCQNTGGVFGTDDTIRFANALFASGTPAITLQSTLRIGGQRRPGGRNLHIDAGAGRKVTVQRNAASPDRFSVITGVMGYSDSHGTAHGSLRLSGLNVRSGIANNGYGAPQNGQKYALDAGGGVSTLYSNTTIDRCEIRDNTATIGGGVYAGQGALVVESSIIAGNAAVGAAGHPAAAAGGGLSTTGLATIRNSTISGNTSTGSAGGAAISSMFGGVSVTNSTISGNASLAGSVLGAAIALRKTYQPVLFLNSTIACNSGPAGASAIGIHTPVSTTVTAKSTIFADTTNTRCTTALAREITVGGAGLTITGDRNLLVSSVAIDISAPFAVSPLVADPQLGTLQDNGGPTVTHAIGAASPARNAGSNPAGLDSDQRGGDYSRVVGGRADIGAFEHPFAGLCGTAHGGAFASLDGSSPNLCSAGASLQGFFGTGPWSWFCAPPSDPSSNEFCGASVLANASLAILDANNVPVSSAVWGQPLRLRAVVSGAPSMPTGGVTFFDVTGGGAVPLCVDMALSGGIAICDTATVPPLATGSRQLRAVYGGSGTYGTASSAHAIVSITPAASTTTIVSHAPDPVSLGAEFTVVAGAATVQPSIGVAMGLVEVEDATDATSCTFALGSATHCTLVARSAGTHALGVSYLGDGNVSPSQAAAVQQVTPGATMAIASVAPPTITLGDSASVTATLATNVPPAIAAPTGTIAVGGAGASCEIVVPATACTLTPHAAGMQSISADYPGDGNFSGAIATATLEVARAATSVSVAASPFDPALGVPVMVSAELAMGVPPGIASPGGSIVVIADGMGEACSIALPAAGCTWTPPGAGTHVLRAEYVGDANFMPSQSITANVEVSRGATTIALALSSAEITLGEAVTVTAEIVTGVPPAVATPGGALLVDDGAGGTCTIMPPEASCELTPGSVGALTITAAYGGDANFDGSSASAALDVANLPAQLALAIDDGRAYARYGETLTYTITLDNSGQGPTGDVAVLGTPSANFSGAVLSWTCAPASGATCAAGGSGTVLADTVTLPANSSLTWTVNVMVPADASGDSVVFAVDAGNVSVNDADTLVLLRDGFD